MILRVKYKASHRIATNFSKNFSKNPRISFRLQPYDDDPCQACLLAGFGVLVGWAIFYRYSTITSSPQATLILLLPNFTTDLLFILQGWRRWQLVLLLPSSGIQWANHSRPPYNCRPGSLGCLFPRMPTGWIRDLLIHHVFAVSGWSIQCLGIYLMGQSRQLLNGTRVEPGLQS